MAPAVRNCLKLQEPLTLECCLVPSTENLAHAFDVAVAAVGVFACFLLFNCLLVACCRTQLRSLIGLVGDSAGLRLCAIMVLARSASYMAKGDSCLPEGVLRIENSEGAVNRTLSEVGYPRPPQRPSQGVLSVSVHLKQPGSES